MIKVRCKLGDLSLEGIVLEYIIAIPPTIQGAEPRERPGARKTAESRRVNELTSAKSKRSAKESEVLTDSKGSGISLSLVGWSAGFSLVGEKDTKHREHQRPPLLQPFAYMASDHTREIFL